uniref:RNA polymerase sigma factor (sigA) n=1 Tax=Anabaena sp. TaxID=1167 RepID=Q04388_9NOST|nr:ORF1 [Nostoc sp. PCC 7120 = FACHB-418]
MPQKCRKPWPENSSINVAAKKPIIARRPFQISAWGVKPQRQELRSSTTEAEIFVVSVMGGTPN